MSNRQTPSNPPADRTAAQPGSIAVPKPQSSDSVLSGLFEAFKSRVISGRAFRIQMPQQFYLGDRPSWDR
jgi:hypothetical protein